METKRTRDEEDGKGRWKRRGLGMKKTGEWSSPKRADKPGWVWALPQRCALCERLTRHFYAIDRSA